MEEVVIRQAPRSLQTEVAQMMQTEKMIEASMQIGKGTRSAVSANEGTHSQSKGLAKDTSGSGTVKKDGTGSQQQMNDADGAAQKRETAAAMASMYITNPGKGSLMQRMASPTAQPEKKGGPNSTFGNTLMTTMAATKTAGAEMSMNSSQGSMMQTQRFAATHHSSPFRESIVRGMVTGVGLLGKK